MYAKSPFFAAVIAAITAIGLAGNVIAAGETVTVTTLEDASDFGGAQQVNDLPGPDGRVSLREAVTATNNTAGPQTIAFAVPTSEFWLVPGMGLLKIEQNAFFLNDSGTTVDFSTQTVNIGDTNPNGPEIGFYGLEPNAWGVAAIFVNGNNCVIKGLGKVYQRGYAVRMVGNNNRLIGSQIDGPLHSAVHIAGYLGSATPTGNIVGGTTPGEGNRLSGVRIDGPSEGNIVIGNTLITGGSAGVEVRGATQYGVITRDNRIGGPTAAERNVIAGVGYYGEEGFPVGARVSIVDADGTLVEGNYIGTTADGMAGYPQLGPIGVEVRDSRDTTVRSNLIAGLRVVGTNHYAGQIFGQAIYVGGTNANTENTVIEGNTIGLAADGVTPIVTRSGVTVSPVSGVRHALGTRIASNHIAHVETTGVVVGSQENGVTITGNSIHDCGGLGIDLFSGNFGGVGGVTPNDPGDVDVGGNGLQNFPVLGSATTTGSTVMIQGTLDSSPSAQFIIEFFSSASCDPSGFGEGAIFLGSTPATTNGVGHATFSITLPAAVVPNQVVTATATRVSTGDTSEFSACRTVIVAPAPTPSSVVSRKAHGSAGIFDIALPLSGNPGIECRSGGQAGDHRLVFTFASPVTLGGASVFSEGSKARVSGDPLLSADGRTVTVDLTNVSDAQTLSLMLTEVNNGSSSGAVTVRMAVLTGDVNADGVVNTGDALQARTRSGQAIMPANFRFDVNADGFINSGDVLAIRSRAGMGLP